MRVRISYGMDIKDVPSKVNELIWESAQNLKKISDSLDRAVENNEDSTENIPQIIQLLDKMRKKLSDVDLTLTDVESICLGLDNYYNGEEDVSEGRPTMDSSGDAVEETSSTGEG